MGIMCTTTSLETLMHDTSWTSTANMTALGSALITQSEREIRKRLAKRYDISSDAFQTSTSIPPVLRTVCEWYSMGLMYGSLSRGSKDAFKRADWWMKMATDNLKALAKSEADLVNTTGSTVPERTESFQIKSNTDGYTDTFAEDEPTNWAIDSDKLDDIESDRS